MISVSEKLVLGNDEMYEFHMSDSIIQFRDKWNLASRNHLYTQYDYLSLLENYGPLDYSYIYGLVTDKSGEPIGTVYCQHKTLDLNKDYRLHAHSNSLIEKSRISILKFLFSLVKHDMLTCGNVLLTGEFGFHFNIESKKAKDNMLTMCLDKIQAFAKAKFKRKVKSVFLKDFYTEDSSLKKETYSAPDFTVFQVQPDMVVPINPDWRTYDDYLSQVKSKYRVKFKKTKKKGSSLVYKELSLEEAGVYNEQMYLMYKSTADRASYSMFLLHPDYFYNLKKTLQEKLSLTAVFLDGKLVAFYTFIKEGSFGDAHFLGYNVSLNSRHQIYFNILLRLIEQAIDSKVSHLNLSRTALEIKSSVGAEPHDMNVAIKYHVNWINKLMPMILDKTTPENNWEARSPFK